MDPLHNYRNLVEKTDEKFASIQKTAGAAMACRSGCHGCCQPSLSVSAIEKRVIRDYLSHSEGLKAELAGRPDEGYYEGTRCFFLDRKGKCSIYPVRPLICRSHGAPIFWHQEGHRQQDVCPLNFDQENLDEIKGDLFINIDLLNTLLALINQQYSPESRDQRWSLDKSMVISVD